MGRDKPLISGWFTPLCKGLSQECCSQQELGMNHQREWKEWGNSLLLWPQAVGLWMSQPKFDSSLSQTQAWGKTEQVKPSWRCFRWGEPKTSRASNSALPWMAQPYCWLWWWRGKGGHVLGQVFLLVFCSFMGPFSFFNFFLRMNFWYQGVSLVQNYLILNFPVNKQRQDFHTELSALTSVVQNHPWSPFASRNPIYISFKIYPLSHGSVLGLTKPSSFASLGVTEMLGEGSMPQVGHGDYVDD